MTKDRSMDILAEFDEFFEDSEFRDAYQDAEFRAQLIADLRAFRKARGLSQTHVAATMTTTQSAVSDFERGETDPYLSTIQRYVRAIGARLRIVLDTPDSNVTRVSSTTPSPYAQVKTTLRTSATQNEVLATAPSEHPTPYTRTTA